MLPVFVFGVCVFIVYLWSQRNEGERAPDEHADVAPTLTFESADADDMIVTGYVNGEAKQLSVAPIGDGYYLRADAAQAFKRMREACLAECGEDLPVSTAFRTWDEQQALFDSLGPTVAAKPGYSNHQNGIALDLHGLNPAQPNYRRTRDAWLNERAAAFGWTRTGLNFSHVEQWHLDFTG